jgi:hypothetical protein
MKRVLACLALTCAFACSIKANPQLKIRLEKSSFEINEPVTFDLQVINNDEPKGYLLSNSTLIALTVDLPMHLYSLEDKQINKGLVDSNRNIPPTTSFFLLPLSTYVGCKKAISLTELNLPPGKYIIKIWIPEMRIFDKNLRKKAIKAFNREPFLEKLEAEAEFMITSQSIYPGDRSSIKSENGELHLAVLDVCEIKALHSFGEEIKSVSDAAIALNCNDEQIILELSRQDSNKGVILFQVYTKSRACSKNIFFCRIQLSC